MIILLIVHILIEINDFGKYFFFFTKSQISPSHKIGWEKKQFQRKFHTLLPREKNYGIVFKIFNSWRGDYVCEKREDRSIVFLPREQVSVKESYSALSETSGQNILFSPIPNNFTNIGIRTGKFLE